jgi:hypothetical protein
MYAVIDNQPAAGGDDVGGTCRPFPGPGNDGVEAGEPQAGRAERPRPIGGEVYRSENGGNTWKKMNAEGESIGGGKWYGWIYIDPNNDKVVYVPSVNFYRSLDGGRTWGKKGPENLAPSFHVDYHAFWIDPRDSNHMILGSDGGLAISWDFGATWDVFDHLPLAQYYAVGVDMEEPYNIYGGLQDNGSVKIPSNGPRGSITRDDWVMTAAATACTTSSIRRTAAGSTTNRRMAPYSESTSATAPRDRSAPWHRRKVPPTGTTGRLRSTCHRTTRASSTSDPSSCTARSTAATRGRSSAPTSRRTTL